MQRRPAKENPFLQPSPYEADGGELIGRDPRTIPPAELRAAGYITSPLKAIRAKCLDCSCGSIGEVRKCVMTHCSLWPFRMTKNVFYGTGKDEDTTDTADVEDLDAAFA